MNKSNTILESALHLLGTKGYTATSMRLIAQTAGVQPSVLYHYYPDKKELLREARNLAITKLKDDFKNITAGSASELLRKQLTYQIENRLAIVALLQYFMAASDDFPGDEHGYVPEQAYAHILHYINRSAQEQKATYSDQFLSAKMILHMIDGFLIEYADRKLSRQQIGVLVERLASFIEAGLHSTAKKAAVY